MNTSEVVLRFHSVVSELLRFYQLTEEPIDTTVDGLNTLLNLLDTLFLTHISTKKSFWQSQPSAWHFFNSLADVDEKASPEFKILAESGLTTERGLARAWLRQGLVAQTLVADLTVLFGMSKALQYHFANESFLRNAEFRSTLIDTLQPLTFIRIQLDVTSSNLDNIVVLANELLPETDIIGAGHVIEAPQRLVHAPVTFIDSDEDSEAEIDDLDHTYAVVTQAMTLHTLPSFDSSGKIYESIENARRSILTRDGPNVPTLSITPELSLGSSEMVSATPQSPIHPVPGQAVLSSGGIPLLAAPETTRGRLLVLQRVDSASSDLAVKPIPVDPDDPKVLAASLDPLDLPIDPTDMEQYPNQYHSDQSHSVSEGSDDLSCETHEEEPAFQSNHSDDDSVAELRVPASLLTPDQISAAAASLARNIRSMPGHATVPSTALPSARMSREETPCIENEDGLPLTIDIPIENISLQGGSEVSISQTHSYGSSHAGAPTPCALERMREEEDSDRDEPTPIHMDTHSSSRTFFDGSPIPRPMESIRMEQPEDEYAPYRTPGLSSSAQEMQLVPAESIQGPSMPQFGSIEMGDIRFVASPVQVPANFDKLASGEGSEGSSAPFIKLPDTLTGSTSHSKGSGPSAVKETITTELQNLLSTLQRDDARINAGEALVGLPSFVTPIVPSNPSGSDGSPTPNKGRRERGVVCDVSDDPLNTITPLESGQSSPGIGSVMDAHSHSSDYDELLTILNTEQLDYPMPLPEPIDITTHVEQEPEAPPPTMESQMSIPMQETVTTTQPTHKTSKLLSIIEQRTKSKIPVGVIEMFDDRKAMTPETISSGSPTSRTRPKLMAASNHSIEAAIIEVLHTPIVAHHPALPSFHTRDSIFLLRNPLHHKSQIATHCHTCGITLSRGLFSKNHYCHYYCRYFCDDCFSGKLRVIPYVLLTHWNAKPFPVSDAAAVELDQLCQRPAIDCSTENELVRQVPLLRSIIMLRTQLQGMAQIVSVCADKRLVLAQFGDRSYLYNRPGVFSFNDLISVHNGSMLVFLKSQIRKLTRHLKQCRVCSARGFQCPICRSEDLIFPFNFVDSILCKKCKTYYHRKCFEAHGSCMVCEMQEAREAVRRPRPRKSSQPLV